jgi:hypothetical protein
MSRQSTTARRAALASSALALILAAQPLAAQTRCDEALVPQPDGCARLNADVVVEMPTGENAELIDTQPGGSFEATGFSISIDGETVAGAPAPADPRRQADIAADAADIDIRFDGLDRRRLLNVSTTDLRAAYRAGDPVTFRASANYPVFIERAEVRILDSDRRGRPTVAILPVAPNGEVTWAMPADGPADLLYVLRVYDAAGRYDETAPLDLQRTSSAFETHATTGPVIAAGEGEDRTRLRNIPVRGGLITASGSGAAPGGTVMVMGEPVPVDASGRFVSSRILPAGDHIVTVEANGRRIVRDVTIPASEWFYVGIADLTFGRRLEDELAEADPDYERSYAEGRLAFYATGTTQRGYSITGSADTGNGDLEDIFRRLNDKDPRKVLQRLDPEDGYPTFGDDSSAFDDAPTSGRFYLRVERDGSRLTWGDFKSQLGATEFLATNRALYGAELRYVTPEVTEDGTPRARVTLYAAQPDSLPQRDILRGTGGSIYFLSRQDINGDSETIAVRATDPDTGRVVGEQRLIAGVDYEIDYIQGVLILAEPLSSSAAGVGLIRDGAIGDYDIDLVAQYEYTPTTGDLDGASLGGRVEVMATDDLRLGVTATSDETGVADQRTTGADLRWNLGELSYIEAEIAQTDGPGFGRALSTDGGLTITSDGVAGAGAAMGYRFDSQLDLTDLGLGTPGTVSLYYERREEGFSTLTEDITDDQTLYGVTAEVELSPRLSFGVDAERFESADGRETVEGEVRLSYDLDDRFTLGAALGYTDKTTPGDADETGERLDAAVQLDVRQSEDLSYYVFGQATLDRSGGIDSNNRIGAGLDARLGEKVRIGGELSQGDGGLGARARLSYAPTADNEVYMGYTLDPTRTLSGYDLVGADDGTFLIGGRYRYSATVSTFFENSWDLFGERRSITEGYGVTYTPDARWTFSAALESGGVRDDINGDFDRDAYSLGVAYADSEDVSGRVRLEFRTEDGDGLAQDRETWGLTAAYSYKLSDDWRFVASADALYSDSAESSFRNGEYLEATLGYAYRPVMNERLNLLARYTYLRDLPGEDQVTADGSTDGPLQVSHVFSIDGDYDLTQRLTFGAKYGYRSSEIAPRGTEDFSGSTAHLGILRLDWHVVHKWDVMGELRALHGVEENVTESGALLGVYRHVGNNAKVGIGYEWGRVSDDLTDLDYDGSGVFLNIIAKF